jgi:AcrR family transcriptional regulator
MDMAQKRENYSLEELNPETRRKLEAAVLDVFSKGDFHQADIRTVAKKAGVSFGTIYKYYGSKEGLLFTFLSNWIDELCERIIDHLQGIENLKEKLRKVFWVQLDYYERNQNMGRILFMTVPMATWMADKTFVQKKMINIFLNVLRQGQEEGVLNPNVRAGVLLDFMYGLVQRSFYMWIYRGQKESLSGQANILFDLIWRSISNSER